ncbi:MAG: ATP-dependent zinc protease [Desulfotignum sp.]|nr:ATP-dependent zinc protease [Desulfotignum sp.]MCF8125708.1 ATP-dependent zinc protease [Desulfotignum sp.]
MKKKTGPGTDPQAIIGWKEWLSLPDLGIPAIKAKIDTGARTSALHTFSLETFTQDSRPMVRFGIHPLQKRRDIALFCEAPVVDRRRVKDSGGHSEMRYVIASSVVLGNMHWLIQITLTNRDAMMFRMLLGRTALENKVLVDPGRSYAAGRKLSKTYAAKTKKGDV